jgi:hypothetical protein
VMSRRGCTAAFWWRVTEQAHSKAFDDIGTLRTCSGGRGLDERGTLATLHRSLPAGTAPFRQRSVR